MMIGAIGLFAGMSVMIKLIGPDYHPAQTIFFRNMVAAMVIFPFILKNGGIGSLSTKQPKVHITRALFGVFGNILYFYAFTRLALADVVVVSQAVPLFVSFIAATFLGETVGWRRWSSILVGFAGVVIAVNPTGTIELATMAAIIATLFWAITMLLTRHMGKTESPYTIVFYYMLTGAIVTGITLPLVWESMSSEIYILIFVAGVLGAFAQILMTYALKLAEASVVSPFNYTAIIWGIIFDLTIWNVTPSMETITGAIIISVAGLYLLHREGIRKNVTSRKI